MCNLSKGVREKGRADGILSAIKNLVKNMGVYVEQAMSVLEIPETERQQLRKHHGLFSSLAFSVFALACLGGFGLFPPVIVLPPCGKEAFIPDLGFGISGGRVLRELLSRGISKKHPNRSKC